MKENPTIYLITGLSGAGKTFLLKAMEDEGYYTVDNVPPHLIKDMINIICTSEYSKVAVVSDIRWKNTKDLIDVFLNIESYVNQSVNIKKVFLYADKQILMKRFMQSRRGHPLGVPTEEAIEKEMQLLNPIKDICDIVLDSSNTEPSQLRKRFFEIINEGKRTLKLNIVSFGFKYGYVENSDYVFDVRYLPNPYYIFEMYKLTGLDHQIAEYLENFEQTGETVRRLFDFACFVQDNYSESGRIEAYFCIGCTGGKHRSVYIAQRIYELMREQNREVSIFHRDMIKE